jgi:hypothetical protein
MSGRIRVQRSAGCLSLLRVQDVGSFNPDTLDLWSHSQPPSWMRQPSTAACLMANRAPNKNRPLSSESRMFYAFPICPR